VPQFLQSTPSNGNSSSLDISAFCAIYMEDVYAGCSNSCAVDSAPGPWNTSAIGSSKQNAQATTAWVFPNGMLPTTLRGNPDAIGQNSDVQLVQ
jgi:hypothetical protein